MNERAHMDYPQIAKGYFAEAERIGERIRKLRKEYRQTGDVMLRFHIENLRAVQRDMEQTGLQMVQRAEWRRQEKKGDF